MNLRLFSNVFNIALIILILAVFYLIVPSQQVPVQSIMLPNQHALPKIPEDQVQFLSHAPSEYNILAYIHIEMHYPGDDPSDEQQAVLDQARMMAANYGADAVIIEVYGHTLGTNPVLDTYTFRGVAIDTQDASTGVPYEL